MAPSEPQSLELQVREQSIEMVRQGIRERLDDHFGRSAVGRISLLCQPKSLSDDTTKLRVDRSDGTPLGVVLCSPEIAPDRAAHTVDCIQAARAAMGERLARHVLEPIWTGDCNGLSFMMLPYRESLSNSRVVRKLQKIALIPRLLRWRLDVARATLTDSNDPVARARIAQGLAALVTAAETTREVRDAAEAAANALDQGTWAPRYVLVHGDLWMGNVLLGDPSASIVPTTLRVHDFTVIDWPGLDLAGPPFRDLLSLSISLGCSPRRIGAEIRQLARIVDCSRGEVRHYVAASLGLTLNNLNYFPYEGFVKLANSMIRTTDAALLHF